MYVEDFERYVSMIQGLEEDYLLDVFVNGLKEDLAYEVLLYEPRILTAMIKKTLLIDGKNRAIAKVGNSGGSKIGSYNKSAGSVKTGNFGVQWKGGTTVSGSTNSTTASASSVNKTYVGGDGKNRGTFKRLSDAELKEKLSKGECFRCEEKFGLEHV